MYKRIWVIQYLNSYKGSNGRIIIGKDLKENVCSLIDVIPPTLDGRTDKNHDKYSVRTAGVPAGI
jgi:hypothetical protein